MNILTKWGVQQARSGDTTECDGVMVCMAYYHLHSGNLTQLLNMAIYSGVFFPLNMVIFHSYVSLPEGIIPK